MNYTMENNILCIDIDTLFCETIQEFLDTYIPSRKMQHLMIQNKWILMDGNPVKREDDIAGLKLMINLYPQEYPHEQKDVPLDILYEDEILLIVNKPKGLLVHSDGGEQETLTEMVKYHYGDTCYDLKPLHRLDQETSGLLMFSKSMIFQPLLDQYLSEKKIRRNYLAFVSGKVDEASFVVDSPIGKDRHNPNKRIIYDKGQKALTRFRLIASNKRCSLLRCTLDSGRTHQIRVHLASIGHPILNDDLYGYKSDLCIRMGLFADEIAFFHPLKEEQMVVDCELPKDLSRLYERLS